MACLNLEKNIYVAGAVGKALVKNCLRTVIDSANEIGRIVDEYSVEFNIVMKIDCEGEEYRVLGELNKTGVLSRIDFIMLEWHYERNKRILECFEEARFSYWHSYKSGKMGQIYAYRS